MEEIPIKKKKLVEINKIGMGIELCIEVPNWLMLEDWCNVFHQFTKNLIIGILISSIQIKIEAMSVENFWKRSAPG